MTAQPRLLDAPTATDLREARVLFWGVGTPPMTLVVRISGETDPAVILAPPKEIPRVGARVAVKLCRTETGAEYWQLAGGAA